MIVQRIKPFSRAVFERLSPYDPALLLIVFYLLLVPFGRAAAVPMAVMSISGIVLVITGKVSFHSKSVRIFIGVFLCFWIPIVFSIVGAVNPSRTASVLINFLQYFFAGLYTIRTISLTPQRHQKLLLLSSWILLFWIFDAFFQMAMGHDIFGFTYGHGALNGPFGSGHPKLGIYLAALSPLLIVYAGKKWHWLIHFAVISSASLVILLAGRRGGWIMLAMILVAYLFWLVMAEKKINFKWIFIGGFFFLLMCTVAYQLSSQFSSRVDQSLLVFDGSHQSIDQAISVRLPIWSVAIKMFKEHPFNGVGARGFRYSYRDFATADDPFIQDPDSLGAFYPHQILLEIGAETGIIGLAGFLMGCFLLLKSWISSGLEQRKKMLPYALALLAILFPLNTHYATYSSHWSALIFWCIALYYAQQETDLKSV